MKRLLALLLTICMVASFGSSYAAAENTETDTKTEATNTEPTIDEKDSNINLEPTDGIIDTNTTVSSLIYSTLYEWNASTMKKYNCYAYVLGVTNRYCYPGDFSENTYLDSYNVTKTANIIVDDLKTDLKYNCVKKQSSRPTSTGVWENVIALRKQSTNNKDDFHLAKLSGGKWYHKPGNSAVLMFKQNPDNATPWILEGYDENGYYRFTDEKYDSNIIYILYKKNHNNTSTWTGEHYHSNGMHYFKYTYKCQNCGNTNTVWTKKVCSGPPCTLPSSIIPTPEVS